jgi:hypothetical protein
MGVASMGLLGHLVDCMEPDRRGKWDEAITDIFEQLERGDGISKDEKGETVLRMVASIASAKK